MVRYWEYKDRLKLLWGDREVPDKLNLIFVLPMPKSWSGKKRLAMKGQPCQSKPDIDNLVKGWMDALLDDDARIWSIQASKVWGETGSIELC